VSGTRSVAVRAKAFSAGVGGGSALAKTSVEEMAHGLPAEAFGIGGSAQKMRPLQKTRAAFPGRISISIVLQEPMWRAHEDVIRVIRRAARAAAAAEPGSRQREAETPELCILLADDACVGELNRRYRHRRKPTNVLSFPAAPVFAPRLGDIVLGYGVLRREAAAQGKSLAAHAAHLTIHGVLHLFGYDHQNRREAAAMENLEISLLTGLGYPNPYESVPVRRRSKRPRLPR
jgi:probable rRNA maturation factor